MANLKYISKDSLDSFILGMSNYETVQLLQDTNVLELLDGKVPTEHQAQIPPYEAAEAFLYLFQQREDYELCQKIIENWPQLRINA